MRFKLTLKKMAEDEPPFLWNIFVLCVLSYFFWDLKWGSQEEKRWPVVVGAIHPAISLSISLYENLVWLYRKYVLKGELFVYLK